MKKEREEGTVGRTKKLKAKGGGKGRADSHRLALHRQKKEKGGRPLLYSSIHHYNPSPFRAQRRKEARWA